MLIDCMMADIAEVLSYLPTAILVGAAYALVAGIVFRFMRKRAASSGDTPGKVPFGENSVFKLTISTLLVIYVVVVLMTVFFFKRTWLQRWHRYAHSGNMGNDDAGSCVGA